jgi:hypothetical protein
MSDHSGEFVPFTRSDLWRFVHDVVSPARHLLNEADRELWGIFGLPDGPEKRRRYEVAAAKVQRAHEILTPHLDRSEANPT